MIRVFEYFTFPLGRLLLSCIFLMSGIHKIFSWPQTAESMRQEGMQFVPFFLIMAILFEVGGGFLVLLGLKARLGALALLVFLVPVTLIFHDFWQYQGEAQTMQMINFLKNTAILGGLLVLLGHGAGPISFDACCQRRREKKQKKD